ncbi:MAG TPA: hypothetical protein VGP47_10235 [Parachlamydiaceae bacterium]|nr:hypothetical protein [Parachlamydiaceae bacterium]
MIYLLRGFLLCLIFYNCLSCNSSSQHISPPYVEMAAKIRSEVAHKLAKRHNMRIFGLGGGMADCVNFLGLDFQIQGPLSKEQLRRILIDSVQELLKAVNSDEQIRPFLKNYPFTEKEIMITLFVIDKRGENIYDPQIAVATSGQGTMSYNTDDKDNKFVYKQKIKEDYQTALKIINDENKK